MFVSPKEIIQLSQAELAPEVEFAKLESKFTFEKKYLKNTITLSLLYLTRL